MNAPGRGVFTAMEQTAWPLVGRGAEMELLARALSAKRPLAGALLSGEAGTGKTRLAREALGAAARRGAVVRWAVGSASARTLPLGAFAQVLRVPAASGTDPATFLRERAQDLVARAPSQGVLLGVDDAHLLDDVSATLVHQLAVSGTVRMVVTLRDGEPTPDAVRGLWKDGHLAVIDVRPLGEEETRSLLETVLGGPLETRSAAHLWTITRGNPLFLRQLVGDAVAAGTLAAVEGVWRWRGDAPITSRLAELVDVRIGGLPQGLREVLTLLAFVEPLGAALLATLVGPVTLEDAERRGLVVVERDGRRLQARLAHPLFGEVLRARTPLLRARRVRARLADALARTGRHRHGDTLQSAVLVLEADTPADHALLTEAAQQAHGLADFALGERLARPAWTAAQRYDAGLVLGLSLAFQGKGEEAASVLTQLSLVGSEPERHMAAMFLAIVLAWGLGRAPDAANLLTARERAQDPAHRAEARALGALLMTFRGRTSQAEERAREVLKDSHASDVAIMWAAAAGPAFAARGRGDEMAAILRRGQEAADRVGQSVSMRFSQSEGELLALILTGRLNDAQRAAERYRQMARDGGTNGVAALHLAQVALARGDLDTAVRRSREAIAVIADGDPSDWRFLSGLVLAQALAMRGEAAPAREAVTRAKALMRETGEFFAPEVALAEAWVAAADGTLSQAVALARAAAGLAAAREQPALEGVALHVAGCFGDAHGAERLAEIAAEVDGVRARAAAAHLAGLAAGDGAALDTASRELEAFGALLLAADAAAQAAAAHVRRGRRPAALAAAARAHEFAARCGGARTPAIRATAQPLPLTPREREVASLVGAGLTNREIAERLVLSVRTVEGFVYRACAKLGVGDRRALRAVLVPAGPQGEPPGPTQVADYA